jgi:hypothetical protein
MNSAQRVSVFVVLCVAGMSAEAAAPAGRFVVSSDTKTVTDTKTGLVWQRDVPNVTKNWSDARAWCRNNSSSLPDTGWRLPSIEELQTIVDSSVVSPAIDAAAFPNTPSDWFWTSSPWAGSSSSAWSVAFYDGDAYDVDVSYNGRVRCVR